MGERTDGIADAEQLAQRYRSLVEHTPDGICVHEHGIVVYVNQATVRLLAAERAEQIVGKPLTRFVHPDSVPAMLDRIAKLTTSGAASAPTEMRLLRLDGESVPVETVSVLTPWHDHHAYQVVIHDLTAQRAAEDAQRRAEQHFTTVVSQLEEGVVVIDRSGRIESANPAARRIFGGEHERDDVIVGRSIEDLPLTLLDANAQPLPPARHPMARTLATGETVSGYIFGIDRLDGQRRWLSGSSRLLNPGDPHSPAVSSFADITEFRASRRQLEYQATHDSLTGLANRSLVLSRLAATLATDSDLPYSTVLFIDLDGFKAINDTLGHAIGDTVLQIVAQRLQRALRGDDLVGRLGGDEFLVLLAGRGRRVDVDTLVTRLRTTMSEPIVARGHRIAVDASIGVTELTPGDRRTPEAVLHDADQAMYQAKPPGHRESGVAKARTGSTG
ncbi:diguanylate cyclase [Nocardia puris]|uniref:PAS domain S-box-containing protein/diguanylate cyclase (GGDEF)-like protein n=1 Tax=Nocardia puris TaxID=208602 RepID=A0A366DHU8_9NOCA|nr:diguanylate cyclase [Nocardia puris]MBF6213339.1 diguanylate cyclase [Nocardia puris]MBF6369493.1 diguanylate cyclase [Nocardia puris]MBF6462218.1 diguanylate cyclase [Nocardia puris]RBO89525.1 PAS domain S-box-containing protein/diguanylate cyclase (GGDEF)-like protein [Nocardia puris]